MKATFFVIGLLFFALLVCGSQPRIVAVGDIHGDLQSFEGILRSAGVLDAGGNWAGGNTVLVQTGDAVDRGSNSKQVLDLLMKLESQAPGKGGRVHVLLGNHETMNIMSDLRYVPAAEFQHFAAQNTGKRLKEAYESFKDFQIQKAERRKQPVPQFTPQLEEEWLKAHPAGFIEYVEAFGPDGKYGKWLRRHNAVLELQQNVFLHGGISPKIATMSVKDINRRIQEEIQLFDRLKKRLIEQKVILPFHTFNEMIDEVKTELNFKQKDETLEAFIRLGGWLSIFPEGPLWFRGYAEWTDEELSSSIPSLLNTYKARRFIVGHTVMKNGQIQARHQNNVIIIDTGMNGKFYPQGRASALVIEGEKLTAVYSDQKVPIAP